MALLLSIQSDIMIFRILFILGFVLAIDFYAYQAFKTVLSLLRPHGYIGVLPLPTSFLAFTCQ